MGREAAQKKNPKEQKNPATVLANQGKLRQGCYKSIKGQVS